MEEPWTFYCTSDRVFQLHEQAMTMAVDSDPTVPRDARSYVERSLGAAASADLYAQAPRGGLAFVGFALYYFTMNHCFVDDNKRVG